MILKSANFKQYYRKCNKMKKPVIIIGAGGHAKVLMDCLRLMNVDIVGMLDKNPSQGNGVGELPIIGDDSAIFDFACDAVKLVNGIGSVGDTSLRTNIFNKFKNLGYSFRSVIHPNAIVAENCYLGEGVQVMAGAVINTGTKIAADTIVNTGAVIDHDCKMGSHVHIAPGVTISGGVQVGDGSHIGTGATIIQSVTIGERALVGAGAVVIHDVASGSKVVGVPAKTL